MADSFVFKDDTIFSSLSPNLYPIASPFHDRSYPTLNKCNFHQTDLPPVSPSLDFPTTESSFVSLYQEIPSTTSEFLDQDAIDFPESYLESGLPPCPAFSESFVSLYSLQADQPYNREEDPFPTSGSLSPVINCMPSSTGPQPATITDKLEDISCESDSSYSNGSSKSPVSESRKRLYSTRRSRKGTSQSPSTQRLNHNAVEKRYRSNINEQISSLWHVVVADDKSDSQQPSKSAVLSAARMYILELQIQNERAERDLEVVKEKSKIYDQLLTNHLQMTKGKVARIGRP